MNLSSLVPITEFHTINEAQKNVVDSDSEKAIDEGFDYLNFPDLDPNEQLDSIPKQMLQHIELEKVCFTRSHPGCEMKKRPSNHGGNWICDLLEGTSKCLSGIKSYNTQGYECWRCDDCDFDLCILCMQADRFIEMMTNRED